ncbi:MAG: DNA mismatch repair protein MutS [Oscillospiraceae bacterium]|nr:DNA mismatch repair protein MutS [Oscillospiraceae bacterium]
MNFQEIDVTKITPVMRQWHKLKVQYPNHILFFRLGDFYEMFFDDAINASRLLDLTLTGRDCGLTERAPMCGIPYHSYETDVKRLLDQNFSVAICEQLTQAGQNALVERDVVRIITPGTLVESSFLDESTNNYICGIFAENSVKSLCFCDISTGEIFVCKKETEIDVINELSRYHPSEIIINDAVLSLKVVTDFIKLKLKCCISLRDSDCFDVSAQYNNVQKHLKENIYEFEQLANDERRNAVCGIFEYITETHKQISGQFTAITDLDGVNYMALDLNVCRNLELTETLRSKERKGSLLWVLDNTKTSMGKRLLRQTILQPLLSPVKISERLDSVEELLNNAVFCADISDMLREISDLERLMTRVMCKSATPRDIRAIADTAVVLPELKNILGNFGSKLIVNINRDISTLKEIADIANTAIFEEAPVKHTDGGVIKDGYNEELDRLRNIINNGDKILSEIEERERNRTGIKPLKIGYNRVFGYYLEITRSYYDLIPSDYIRKQTLSNCERFITDELKQIENDLLGAKDKAVNLETDIFIEIRDFISLHLATVQKTAKALALLDLICSFAQVSAKNDYIKPEIAIDGIISIKDGRHPVIEKILDGEIFVPNDTYLDSNNTRMAIITGPNMSGKSTYMRQTALITLMAQIGCFVPAAYAKISVCDKIFTRIGASDDLTAGQSTFMVEMSEVADILNNATKNSLVVVDEIGRGTSTFDGISIARAVAEYICNSKKLGCKTLFATHYHELTNLSQMDGVKNLSVSVKKIGDSIRFLRKIVECPADDSYGVEVAKLAGLPEKVIKKAKGYLSELENEHNKGIVKTKDLQESFESIKEKEIVNKLRKINVDELSARECQEFLYSLTEELGI